jgi:hypothetical protein
VDFEPLTVAVPLWEDPPGVFRTGDSRVDTDRESSANFDRQASATDICTSVDAVRSFLVDCDITGGA